MNRANCRAVELFILVKVLMLSYDLHLKSPHLFYLDACGASKRSVFRERAFATINDGSFPFVSDVIYRCDDLYKLLRKRRTQEFRRKMSAKEEDIINFKRCDFFFSVHYFLNDLSRDWLSSPANCVARIKHSFNYARICRLRERGFTHGPCIVDYFSDAGEKEVNVINKDTSLILKSRKR